MPVLLGVGQVCAAKEARRGSAAVAPPDAPGKLTPEMLAMFGEAQRNIMELNKSRLAALGELRTARQRIQELGNGADCLPAQRLLSANLCTICAHSVLTTQSPQAKSGERPEPKGLSAHECLGAGLHSSNHCPACGLQISKTANTADTRMFHAPEAHIAAAEVEAAVAPAQALAQAPGYAAPMQQQARLTASGHGCTASTASSGCICCI